MIISLSSNPCFKYLHNIQYQLLLDFCLFSGRSGQCDPSCDQFSSLCGPCVPKCPSRCKDAIRWHNHSSIGDTHVLFNGQIREMWPHLWPICCHLRALRGKNHSEAHSAPLRLPPTSRWWEKTKKNVEIVNYLLTMFQVKLSPWQCPTLPLLLRETRGEQKLVSPQH